MEKQTTDLVIGKKSITGATQTVVERLREQTLDPSSLVYPFINKLKNTSGRTLFPFVDKIDDESSTFTIGSIELLKSDDFTIAEVTDETVEDSNPEVGIELAVQNILDINMVKKIETRLTQALMADTTVHYDMAPTWKGIKRGILQLGSGTTNIVGDIYVAVSLNKYLDIIEKDEFENTMKLLGTKIRLVVMEEFSDTQVLVMHEHGVSGGIKIKEVEVSRRPMYERVDYIAPYNYSFGWDSKYVKFGGVIPPFLGRYFRRNEGTTDRALFSEVNLTDDFEINTLFSTTGSSSHVLFGDDNSYANLLAFIGSGTIRLVVGGVSVFEVDNQNLNDGVLHSAVIKRVGNLITLYVGGALIGSGNSTNTFTLSSLYAHNDGAAAFPGILADFKIYEDGVLIRDYPLDDNSDILANKATVLGFEKVLNPNFNTNSDWILNANHVITGGQLVINGASAFSHSKQVVDVSAGKTQRLSINYDNPQTNIKINIFDGQDTGAVRLVQETLNNAGGTYDFYFTPSSDKVLIYIETINVDHYVAFNYISIKEADGYGQVINGTDDQWLPFDEQEITTPGRFYRYNEGTTDHATVPVITMNGDVLIEFNIKAPAQDDNTAISFRNTNSFNTIGFASGRSINNSSAKMRIFSNSFPVVDDSTSMDVYDNTTHAVRFEYIKSTAKYRLLIDGVEGIPSTTLNYNFAGSDLLTFWRDVTSGDEMAGVISDVKMYDDGVLVRDYPINDGTSILADLTATLGSEELSNTNFTNGLEGWTAATGNWSAVNDMATMGLTNSYTPLRSDAILATGVTYLVVLDIKSITGEMKIVTLNSDLSANTSQIIDKTGIQSYLLVGANGRIEIVRNTEASVSIDSISAKKAPTYGTIVNGTDNQWYKDGQVGGDWHGKDLYTQDIWENPTNAEDQWTFADDKWYLDGDGEINALSLLEQSEQPYRMVLAGNLVAVTGTLTVGASLAPSLTEPGPYSFEFKRDDITLQQFKRKVGVATAALEKPSLREVLKV